MRKDPLDPKNLMYEAYRIDGITLSECRSIFLDWALGVPAGIDPRDHVQALLLQYQDQPRDHPMSMTLRAALKDVGPARRRGGRAGRVAD